MQRVRAMVPKVVLSRHLPSPGQKILLQAAEKKEIELVDWTEDKAADRQWMLSNVKDASGILVMLNDKVDKELIDAAGPNLKVVSSLSAGFDHIDIGQLKAKNIRLGTTPEALTDSVADLSVMLALMAARFGGEAMRAVLEGKWPNMPWSPLLLCGQSFKHKTIGFLGFGRIAQATLVRMLPFGPSKVIYMTSKPGKPASADYYSLIANSKASSKAAPIEPASSLDQLAAESDLLFVCSALTESTKNTVNASFLSKMKPTSVIVNTARGAIVDNDALVDALRENRILGAGLDVVAGEPNIPADHPLVLEKRAVILPHIGSADVETRELMAVQAAQNLLAALQDKEMVSEKKL